MQVIKRHPKVLGFFSIAWQEMVNQRLAGVISYVDEHAKETAVQDFRFSHQYEEVERLPPPPWRGIADGVVICFGLSGSAAVMYDWLKKGAAPLVSLAPEWRHPKIPRIITDKAAVMKMAADHLVQRGYKNFAVVGNRQTPEDMETRRKFFNRRLAKYGYKSFEYDLDYYPLGGQDDLAGISQEQGLVDLLRKAPKPLGIFAVNDNFARAVCLLCNSLKIDVPAEVGIVGMGNLSTSRCNVPAITTIQMPNERIGYEAAVMLLEMIDGKKPKRHTLQIPPVQIIERQSTGGDLAKQDDFEFARQYILSHACEGLEVREIVEKLSVSRRAFEMNFIERTGQSPKQMIQQVRLERARHLLTHSQLSITQVAMMTGFHDVAALSNFISKETGKTPKQLRDGNR